MRRLAWLGIGFALACGRSGFEFPEAGTASLGGDGSDGGGGGHDGSDAPSDDAQDDGFVFVPEPDLPAMAPSCGNGVIDPGELCYLPSIEYASRIDPCARAAPSTMRRSRGIAAG